MVLEWVGMGNVTKQMQSSSRYSRSDWRLVGSVPYIVVGPWAMYGIRRMQHRHHWSNASRHRLETEVIHHVSASYRRIGWM